MELDDLRRHWRQPEPAAPLSEAELSALLNNRTLGVVEKMRRNARLEAGLNVLIGLGLLVALPSIQAGLVLAFVGLLLLLVVVLVVFYNQLLGTLRRMLEPAGSVRGHLATLAQGLRQLLRFYYRVTVACGPVTMVLLWGAELWHMAQKGLFTRWPKAALIMGLFLVLAVGVQLGIVRFARWYVQRLYGRHLDRLEGQLRELDE